MDVRNMMEEVVSDVLNEQGNHLNISCDCTICRNDILALTLNALPPRYVANAKGHAISKLLLMDEQSRADVLRELARAVTIVAGNPSHE